MSASLLFLLLTTGGPVGGKPPVAPVAPVAEARPAAQPGSYTLEEILAALRMVETGGERLGGRHSLGDGGSAIGPYQIRRAYWIDARVPGRFEDCRDARYARAVVLAYWKRYGAKALEARDAETLARIHNGGPDGHKEACTLPFWRKVQRELERARQANAPRASRPPPDAAPATPASTAPAATPRAPEPAPARRSPPRAPLPPPPDLV